MLGVIADTPNQFYMVPCYTPEVWTSTRDLTHTVVY